VPYNPVPLDEATAGGVNQAYAQYNGGLLQAEAAQLITSEEREARTINFSAGQNAVVIEDEYLTDLSALGLPSYRQTTADDLIVLPAASFIGTVVNNNPQLINGVTVPLGDQWVLVVEEQEDVTTATAEFNSIIEAVALQNELAFVDAFTILNEVSTGAEFDEFVLNSNLVTGGAFSLDGVHPTARGYAYLANKFIEALDDAYETKLPKVNASDYNPFYSPEL
ncbi:MAG: G-D-S-L family lipolytic protein, partial [Flavobacteriaceae bacterium]